jgi:hypothetical protein
MNKGKNKNHQKTTPFTRIKPSRLKFYKGVSLKNLFLGHSPGHSLPAALITLAVGTLLLTPFLSYVSTRAKGTGSSGQIFNEGYTADAGIEYGIWSLLNNPSFRSQVDLNATIPQSLTFPGSLNGYTPTITVTGLPLGIWYIRPSAPWTINKGGALAYAGGDRVYALRGDGFKDFGYYSISGNTWSSLRDTNHNVKQGGDLEYGGDIYLYAFRGDKEKDFWRYNISNNNWASMADAPEKVDEGGSLLYDGSDYIYAFGGKSKQFWRYDISGDNWDTLDDAPQKVGFGSDLLYPGGNYIYAFRGANKTDFWRYNINDDEWDTLQAAPDKVRNGGTLAYYSGNYIYALRGNTIEFWRYSIGDDSWTSLTNTPAAVGQGGDMVFTHSEGGFACRGRDKSDFWEFEVTPPRYDISSQAGTVTIDARLEIDGSNKSILFWDID